MAGELIGVLIGGALTLVGTIVTLGADAYHKSRERKLALRRDAYLNLSQAITAPLRLYANCPALNFDMDTAMKELTAATADLNKAHTVAELPTIAAMLHAMEHFSDTVRVITIERVAIEVSRKEVDDIDQFLTQTSTRVEIINEAVDKLLTIPTERRETALASLQDEMRHIMDQRKTAQQRRIELLKDVQRRLSSLGTKAVPWIVEYHRRLGLLNIEIRKEVGLKLNANEYAELMNQTYVRASERAKEWEAELAKQQAGGLK